MDQVLAGQASLDQIGDFVEEWHESTGVQPPLHLFLGLTWLEYSRWVEDSAALNEIVKERKS